MKIVNQLLDYTQRWALPHVLLFTGNPIVKNSGGIVMGRGAAQQVRDFYPGIDIRFGSGVKEHPDSHLLWVTINPDQYIGWFKVKHHWQHNAEPALIAESADQLGVLATEHPDKTFHMNFPGIGNGGLSIQDVIHLLAPRLPHNVYIYK